MSYFEILSIYFACILLALFCKTAGSLTAESGLRCPLMNQGGRKSDRPKIGSMTSHWRETGVGTLTAEAESGGIFPPGGV